MPRRLRIRGWWQPSDGGPRPLAGRRPADDPRLLTALAVAGCCGGFVVLGTLQALYGPAIPAFRARFGVTPAVAGLGLSADFAGALVGVVFYHLLLARAGDRRLLAASYALMAAGMILFAIAPSWPLALGAALVTGFGSGGIDYGLNHLFAIGFGRRSAAMLNLLNAHFGPVSGPFRSSCARWPPPARSSVGGCAARPASRRRPHGPHWSRTRRARTSRSGRGRRARRARSAR